MSICSQTVMVLTTAWVEISCVCQSSVHMVILFNRTKIAIAIKTTTLLKAYMWETIQIFNQPYSTLARLCQFLYCNLWAHIKYFKNMQGMRGLTCLLWLYYMFAYAVKRSVFSLTHNCCSISFYEMNG